MHSHFALTQTVLLTLSSPYPDRKLIDVVVEGDRSENNHVAAGEGINGVSETKSEEADEVEVEIDEEL